MFGQCFQAHDVNFKDDGVWGQGLDAMILVSPSQLSRFCELELRSARCCHGFGCFGCFWSLKLSHWEFLLLYLYLFLEADTPQAVPRPQGCAVAGVSSAGG